MNTLTKMALGMLGQLKPDVVEGYSVSTIHLPHVDTHSGIPLMEAIMQRQSQREFDETSLPEQSLADLMWVAAGINRADVNGRTTPSAMNAQEIQVYAALPIGLYRYAAPTHTLHLVSATDVRRVTGYQDFVDDAPLDLIYVANHARMKLIPAAQRESYASAAAGAMAQNVYLYCASVGLATVIRAWFDRAELSQAMDLNNDQQILLAQTVGNPKRILSS
jgi:SagB-type dehydrogenase family enzyme